MTAKQPQRKRESNTSKEFDGKKLKKIRLEILKLSQENVSRLLNCPTTTYRNWETGRTVPSLAYYFKVKELFKL